MSESLQRKTSPFLHDLGEGLAHGIDHGLLRDGETSARVVKFASRSDLDDDGTRVSGLGSVEDLLEGWNGRSSGVAIETVHRGPGGVGQKLAQRDRMLQVDGLPVRSADGLFSVR